MDVIHTEMSIDEGFRDFLSKIYLSEVQYKELTPLERSGILRDYKLSIQTAPRPPTQQGNSVIIV